MPAPPPRLSCATSFTVRRDLADVCCAIPEGIEWWVTNHVDLDCGHRRLVDLITNGVAVTVNNVSAIEKLTAERTDEQERLAVARAKREQQDADNDPRVQSIRRYRARLRTPQDAA
jgi:ribosomal protein L29